MKKNVWLAVLSLLVTQPTWAEVDSEESEDNTQSVQLNENSDASTPHTEPNEHQSASDSEDEDVQQILEEVGAEPKESSND